MKLFKTKGISILIVITLSVFSYDLSSLDLDSADVNVGIYLGLLQNQHNVDFVDLPGAPNCCVKYDNTSAIGFNAGILGEIGIFPFLDFRFNLGYSSVGADIQSEEYIGNSQFQGELVPVTTQHNLETNINMITANPVISLIPTKKFPIRLNAGFQSGLMIQKTFYQHEDLSDEDIAKGIQFYDGEKELGTSKNVSKGELPEALLYHAITLGAAYDISISNHFIIRPEIAYHYNLKKYRNNQILENKQSICGYITGLQI